MAKKKAKIVVRNRVKSALAVKQKTAKWLALKLGVNRTTVSKWNRNLAQPSLETLYYVADILEIGVRELLEPNKFDR